MSDLKNIKSMIADMEMVQKFLAPKGRFVGDKVHISIKDLADRIRDSAYNKSQYCLIQDCDNPDCQVCYPGGG